MYRHVHVSTATVWLSPRLSSMQRETCPGQLSWDDIGDWSSYKNRWRLFSTRNLRSTSVLLFSDTAPFTPHPNLVLSMDIARTMRKDRKDIYIYKKKNNALLFSMERDPTPLWATPWLWSRAVRHCGLSSLSFSLLRVLSDKLTLLN